jgi:hypothetical protein
MTLRPGEEVHFVALLDMTGETLTTVPIRNPMIIPSGKVGLVTDVEVTVKMEMRAKANVK